MQFQDGSRCGAVLLSVLYLMSLNSSEVKNLSTNQISTTYLNLRLRYKYFRFGKQTSAILEFFFRLLFQPHHSNQRDILHQATKFRPYRATWYGVTTLYTISRWRQQWLNNTSGFIFDDVTLIRRSKSTRKPNFVYVF